MPDKPTPKPNPKRRKDRTAALEYEEKALNAGHRCVMGMDEAGYGAWAGPVAAGAVCLPLTDLDALKETLHGVKDSKQMTPRQREAAFEVIQETALGWGFGFGKPEEINKLGIRPALHLAMRRAFDAAVARMNSQKPDFLLLDAFKWPDAPLKEDDIEHITRGDQLSLTIAAASVVAKVKRDRHMIELHEKHPAYQFASNKGYGTAAHRSALEAIGVNKDIHRTYYRPIRAILEGN